ncbi:MAG: hypothetical protein RL266_1752 [Bacteroidota bacterium]
MVLNLRLFLCSLLFLYVQHACAQVSFESQEELVKAANSYFETKDYEKAKPLFSQLLSKDALNPDYNYRFGVCILFTESDPLKPLPYIEGGANSKGVNVEAYYFLGKAYQFNYRFDDAITYFEKGKKAGYSAPDVDLDKCVDECRNGKILFNPSLDFEPAQDKEVIAAEFYRPYDFRKLKGKVIPMPPNFKTKYDEKNLLGTVVYTPSNSTTLVYASYGEDGLNGKDLYRVNRLPNGEWALPQRLPNTINTKYDEDYAFFDEEANMLFFASEGHNTMGGFDVFSSQYDPSTNSWSVPVNLQYPINSPFDDFLYVSDPEGQVAFFTSKRGTELGKLRVFKTLLYDPAQVELSVVEGTYDDQTDSVFNYMVATVLDPKTNQVIGKYRSQRETGKYVLILPPQNDYVMDVGPREADGFRFDLDVPKLDDSKPLAQGITYRTAGGQGTVTVTNYFDAVGKPDTVALAQNRPQAEVEERMVAMPDATEILAARTAQRSAQQQESALLEEVAAVEAALLEEEKAKIEAAKKEEADRLNRELEQKANAEREAAETAMRIEEEARLERELEQKANAEREAAETAMRIEEEARLERELEQKANAEREAAETAMRIEEEARLKRELEQKAKAEREAAETLRRIEEENAKIQALQKAQEAERLKEELAKADADKQALEMAELQVAKEREQAEQQRLDSIANADRIAAQIAREEAIVDSLESVAAEIRKDSLNQIALEAKRVEEIRQAETRAKLVADSLSAIEALALESAAQELIVAKAKDDSLMAIKAIEIADSLRKAEEFALAEKQRLEQIAREVEAAKAKAMQDSSLVADVEVVEMEQLSLLEEMAAKEAEILAQQKQMAQADPLPEVPKLNSEEVSSSEEINQTEVISEADLFLQTIARLEEQKKRQEAEVSAENQRQADERQKAKQDKMVTAVQEQSELASDSIAKPDSSDTGSGLTEESSEGEEMPVTLKSNADPEEYLAALADIEKEIAKDEQVSTKSYELQDLEKKSADGSAAVDPLLQATIDADRKALSEHQKIAAEKEQALRDQMAKDKEVVRSVVESDVKEVDQIEQELLQGLAEEKPRTDIVPDIVEEKESIEEPIAAVPESAPLLNEHQENELQIDETLLAEADAALNETLVPEPDSIDDRLLVEEAELPVPSEPTQDHVLTQEEAVIASEVEAEVEIVPADPSLVVDEPVQVSEPEVTMVDTVILDEVLAEADQMIEKIQEKELLVEELAEMKEPVAEKPIVVESPNTNITATETQRFSGEVALRDYGKGTTDFSKVKDPAMMRLVKRMRAEDIGRMAVLKNMKNQWVDAGRSQQVLKELKANDRNKDVLANLPQTQVREETLKNPFNKDDLRSREGVSYKLDIRLAAANVSETVSEAMSAEQAATFSMPDFNLSSGYFSTYADAQAEMRYYRGKGFDSVQIIAFLNGEPVLLSTVQNIPFID